MSNEFNVELNEEALLELLKNGAHIECPACGEEIITENGEGTCSNCGQHVILDLSQTQE